MLTVTCEPEVFETNAPAQNEIAVSDCEISRRVMRIRSGWSVAERVRRRREADRRFDELIETLLGAEAA
jgi:hypothetical protein